MKFETKLNEKQARSMLEGLAKASAESGGSFLHTSSNATAKVPATIFDDRLGGKTAAAVVTLIWTKTTGSIQVATKESIKDYMFEAIKALENVYVKALDNVMEPGREERRRRWPHFVCRHGTASTRRRRHAP